MRVRVAFCFASAPRAGSQSDADVQPALEACRNALVKEAIDLSEVAQRYVPVEVAAPAGPAPRPPKPVSRTRVLSNAVVTDAEKRAERRQRWTWVALAATLAAAAAYHGHADWARSRAAGQAMGSVAAPAGFVGLPAPPGGVTVLQPSGEAASPEAIAAFKEAERLKGNDVVELPDGTMVVRPRPPKPQATGRAGAP
jgi:hypothetical protein